MLWGIYGPTVYVVSVQMYKFLITFLYPPERKVVFYVLSCTILLSCRLKLTSKLLVWYSYEIDHQNIENVRNCRNSSQFTVFC